ncbi:hypothetical protein BN1723_020359, partial [Verticillium longisporum]
HGPQGRALRKDDVV